MSKIKKKKSTTSDEPSVSESSTDGRLIIYKFQVEWKIFDTLGTEIFRSSRPFETKKQAEKFVQDLKRVNRNKNIQVLLRELELNEVIRTYKKKGWQRNYRRNR